MSGSEGTYWLDEEAERMPPTERPAGRGDEARPQLVWLFRVINVGLCVMMCALRRPRARATPRDVRLASPGARPGPARPGPRDRSIARASVYRAATGAISLGMVGDVNGNQLSEMVVSLYLLLFSLTWFVFETSQVYACDVVVAHGAGKGDSTSLQRECARSNAREKRIHALSSPREMIARPKMSQNERKTTEIGGFRKLEIMSQTFSCPGATGAASPSRRASSRTRRPCAARARR